MKLAIQYFGTYFWDSFTIPRHVLKEYNLIHAITVKEEDYVVNKAA